MLPENRPVNLKTVAARVGLAPCSVSAVLNNTDAARAIPQATKERVYRAAAELNYRPNFLARSLRTRRTRMVAIVAPTLGRSSVARVVAAAQRRLHQHGYMVVLSTSHSNDAIPLCAQFQQRGIEGVIAIDAPLPDQLDLPVTLLEMGYRTSHDSVADELDAVPELGLSAAEAVMRQIEEPGTSRRINMAGMTKAFAEARPISFTYASAAETA